MIWLGVGVLTTWPLSYAICHIYIKLSVSIGLSIRLSLLITHLGSLWFPFSSRSCHEVNTLHNVSRISITFVSLGIVSILQENAMYGRFVCPSVCLSVCPSVCFHDNSRTSRCRMMKHYTDKLEVKSNMEFKEGSRT